MINDILKNIRDARQLLDELEQDILSDISNCKIGEHGWGWIDNKRQSRAGIERSCIMARRKLKDCYGNGYFNYVNEIAKVKKDA